MKHDCSAPYAIKFMKLLGLALSLVIFVASPEQGQAQDKRAFCESNPGHKDCPNPNDTNLSSSTSSGSSGSNAIVGKLGASSQDCCLKNMEDSSGHNLWSPIVPQTGDVSTHTGGGTGGVLGAP